MHIPSAHVFQVLQEKGVTSIHHANSVATACQFIRSKSLMSRGTVERLGIKQTPQSTDRIDKLYSIWFDVFADSVDIHSRARRSNHYGPVLFEFDTEIIDKTYTGRVWVTKLNPTKWANKTDKQRWFQSKVDLDTNFTRGDFDQMIVFRHCGGELPFKSYLKRIIIDDPKHQTAQGIDLFSMAVGAIRLSLSDSNLDIQVVKRECVAECECVANYAANPERTKSMFDPRIKDL